MSVIKLETQVITFNPVLQWRIPDLDITYGKMIGLFGKSGCGKTSFLEHLFQKQTRNKTSKRRLAYMKQDVILHPELTVYETLWFYTVLRSPVDCEHIDTVLRQLKIYHLRDRKVANALSGGEKKRILLAYHLLDQQTSLFLMDEPFSGLDPENTRIVFNLMREKVASGKCSILLSAHQLDPSILSQFNERWSLDSRSDTKILELKIHTSSEHDILYEEEFIEIDIHGQELSLSHRPSNIENKPTSFFQQWKYLFARNRVIDRQNRFIVLLRWCTPLVVVLLQQLFIGSFSHYLRQWENSQNLVDFIKTIVVHTILLFTVSISPIHILNDHFERRTIVRHETSQGLYNKNAYFFSAVLWDQITLMLTSILIALVVAPPKPLLPTIIFNIMTQMVSTNMFMWVCSSLPQSSFHFTLVATSTYSALAFVVNLGFLVKTNIPFGWIQYTSTIHIQSNLFLQKVMELFPTGREQVDRMMTSFFNIHPETKPWEWVLLSLVYWWVQPVVVMLVNWW